MPSPSVTPVTVHGTWQRPLREALTQLQADQAAVWVDEQVLQLHRPEIEFFFNGWPQFTVPSQETLKTPETALQVWQQMAQAGLSREAVAVAVGGGMVTDLISFCAATFKRGLRTVLVPTTLLAMIDAAWGGKTGLNLPQGKNLVGTFNPPAAVVVSGHWLTTLPPRQLNAGWAEMLKHALIHSQAAWQQLSRLTPAAVLTPQGAELIQSSIAVKQEIVEKDPHEKGLRKALNWGHTAGHALEAALMHTPQALLHGEAVALGMGIEARLSQRHASLAPRVLQELDRAIATVGYPSPFNGLDEKAFCQFLWQDKKNNATHIMPTLLAAPGQPLWHQAVPEKDFIWALEQFSQSYSPRS